MIQEWDLWLVMGESTEKYKYLLYVFSSLSRSPSISLLFSKAVWAFLGRSFFLFFIYHSIPDYSLLFYARVHRTIKNLLRLFKKPKNLPHICWEGRLSRLFLNLLLWGLPGTWTILCALATLKATQMIENISVLQSSVLVNPWILIFFCWILNIFEN